MFNQQDQSHSIESARAAWMEAQHWICSRNFDVIILDEITYLFAYNWLDAGETIAWLKVNRPPDLHLVLTGRNAPAELIGYADLVTEMNEIKHPFREQGIPAQAGVDF